MRRFLAAAATIEALMLILGVPAGIPALAQTPPHVFVGSATLDGEPVPDGTLIQVVIDGRPLSGPGATVQNGKFTLFVTQPNGTNTSLNLAVGGFMAKESFRWQIGGATIANLDASTQLPPIRLLLAPPLPERIKRGDRFQLRVNSDTGIYQATGGKVRVDYDPNVFRVDLDRANPSIGRTDEVRLGSGWYQVSWDYPAPVSTGTWSGRLEEIHLVVLDTAPAGDTLITVHADLIGTSGEPFPLEPDNLTYQVNVLGIPGDFNQDQVVDSADLAALGAVWGKQKGQPEFENRFDVDDDGFIGIGDLVILLRGYSVRK